MIKVLRINKKDNVGVALTSLKKKKRLILMEFKGYKRVNVRVDTILKLNPYTLLYAFGL